MATARRKYRRRYPYRTCITCGGRLVVRIRPSGKKETPREFKKRQHCDACCKPRPRKRQTLRQELGRIDEINAVLRAWRGPFP